MDRLPLRCGQAVEMLRGTFALTALIDKNLHAHPATEPTPMPATASVDARTPEQIKATMLGFAPSCVDATLRYFENGGADALIEMLSGMIEFHSPSGAAKPPAVLNDELRLNQDLGLDSLTLAEMAFKWDDVCGISIETREMVGIQTVGELKAFLRGKVCRS